MKFAISILGALILLGIVGAPAGLIRADETEDFVKEIIQDARTDSQRSAKLMEAVSMTGDNEKLQIALLEKVVEYGAKGLRTPTDYARVERAAQLLARRVPEKAPYWLGQQAKIYRRMQMLTKSKAEKEKLAVKVVALLIKAGNVAAANADWKTSYESYGEAWAAAKPYKLLVTDNLSVRVRAIKSLSKAQEQVAKYIELLSKTPDDADTRSKIVNTLLVTLDDSVKAAKYINEDVDQKLQTYVPLAGKDISTLPFAECKSLGEWYSKELSKNAASLNKYRMLQRALVYYKRALSLHGKADITSAAMKHQISQIGSDLAKLRGVDPLVCVYCLTAGKTKCGQCLVSGKSTGKLQCAKCSSTGRMKCPKCDGKYALKCKNCAGKGYIYVIVKSYYGKRRTSKSCTACSSSGYRHYSTSRKRYTYGKCSSCSYQSPQGSATCTDCAGGGGTKACPTCNGDKVLGCTHCK